MSKLIFSDLNIEYDKEWNKDIPNLVSYIIDEDHTISMGEKFTTNIHTDIVVKDKKNIFLKIPYNTNNINIQIRAVIDNDILILDFEEQDFIDFLKEKGSIYGRFDAKIILLFLFQYLAINYTDTLLGLEDDLNELFEKAIDKGHIDFKKLLIMKKESSLIKRNTTFYKSMISYLDDELDDLPLYEKLIFVLDNTINMVENIESSIYSCIDMYNSLSSNKMNKTMQVLTIITVISLPATIITGIFGMNFDIMPLLHNYYGFTLSMVLLILIIIIEIYLFRKNKYM